MSRRSARLNKYLPSNRIVITLLQNMIQKVHQGKSNKYRLKNVLDVIDYVILHFHTIRHEYSILSGQQSFTNFAKTLYYKIPEFIKQGEQMRLEGLKVKTAIAHLRRYQQTYEEIYTDYQEKTLLENRCQTLTAMISKKQIESIRNCQEMKKHIKQFLINHLPLCYDVLEIIKSYCFYDVKTFTLIQFVKEIKFHIVTMIDSAEHSRKNGFGENEDEDSDEVEHWSFCIDREIEFQANNCRFCGNYWPEYSQDWTPHNILCNCEYV